MDWTALTDEELATALAEGRAEEKRRTETQHLLDRTHDVVLDARNKGYSRTQVAKALTSVVNTYYPEG